MVLLTLGKRYCNTNAISIGSINRGATRWSISMLVSNKASEWMSLPLIEILTKIIGAIIATARLLIIEKDVTRDTLPPNIPVTTGAAEAVGHKKHIIIP